MENTLTIRLDQDLIKKIKTVSKRLKISQSVFAREALRRQLAIQSFNALRDTIMPFAEKAGFLTDDDVFGQIS